jgi:hypothetical protein
MTYLRGIERLGRVCIFQTVRAVTHLTIILLHQTLTKMVVMVVRGNWIPFIGVGAIESLGIRIKAKVP